MHTLLIKICTITFTIHVMLGFFKHFIFININYSDIYYFFSDRIFIFCISLYVRQMFVLECQCRACQQHFLELSKVVKHAVVVSPFFRCSNLTRFGFSIRLLRITGVRVRFSSRLWIRFNFRLGIYVFISPVQLRNRR